jgi:hypothetical protein
MENTKVIIKKNKEEPESEELIARSIIEISDAFSKLNSSKLNKRAIIILLHDAIGQSKIGKKEIEMVLDHAPKLKQYYLKKD